MSQQLTRGYTSVDVQPHLKEDDEPSCRESCPDSSPDEHSANSEVTMFTRPAPQKGAAPSTPSTTQVISNPFPSPTSSRQPDGAVGGKHREIMVADSLKSPVLDTLRDWTVSAFKYQKQVTMQHTVDFLEE